MLIDLILIEKEKGKGKLLGKYGITQEDEDIILSLASKKLWDDVEAQVSDYNLTKKQISSIKGIAIGAVRAAEAGMYACCLHLWFIQS